MSSIVGHNATHAHLRGALEQTLGNQSIGSGSAVQRTSDGQDAVVNTRNNLAHTSLDAGFVTQVSNVLARLADDDAGFLGRNDGAKSQHRLSVLFLGLGRRLNVDIVNHVDVVRGGLVDHGGIVQLGRVHYVGKKRNGEVWAIEKIWG